MGYSVITQYIIICRRRGGWHDYGDTCRTGVGLGAVGLAAPNFVPLNLEVVRGMLREGRRVGARTRVVVGSC